MASLLEHGATFYLVFYLLVLVSYLCQRRVSVCSALQLLPPRCLELTGSVATNWKLFFLFFTHFFSSRAKVAAADGPPGIPTQTLTPVKHTVRIDKDALLQDYGFHISESLPLTVVAVTAGRG